jgi:MFS family permease
MENNELNTTRRAFLWTRVLDTPFWAIFNMLPFILYKDLHATPFQLAIVIALKPLSSLISVYWSALIHQRRDRLRSNIVWGGILRHLPFFFFPWVDNVWFFILAFGFHMMLSRGSQPAWMEILKINIPGVARERIFAFGSMMGYVGDAVLPFVLGGLLDGYFQAWRWIFPMTALMSMGAIFFQRGIAVEAGKQCVEAALSLKEGVLRPWKGVLTLLKSRPDFTRFQIGFMLGGSGLMVMQPALPVFFVDVLNLSYMEFAIALTTCKGIGYAMTSPLWARWVSKGEIFRFTAWVTALATLFPICMILAPHGLVWLYCGYLVYGVMQAGSALSWNMSGPIFSKEEESSLYTSVNVATVGIRGAVAPWVGSILCTYWGASSTMVLGALLCLLATQRLFAYAKSEDKTIIFEVSH